MAEPIPKYPISLDDNTSLIEVKDKKQTTLTSILLIGGTEVNVSSTSGFPDNGYISIENEVLYYDSREATKFKNLLRGCQGTSPLQHASGMKVYLNVLAIHHNILKDAIIAIEAELGINPSGTYVTLAERLSNILTYVSEYKCFEVKDY